MTGGPASRSRSPAVALASRRASVRTLPVAPIPLFPGGSNEAITCCRANPHQTLSQIASCSADVSEGVPTHRPTGPLGTGRSPTRRTASRTAATCASSTCQGRNRRSWCQQRCRREATGTNTSARGGEFTRRDLSPEGRAAMRSGRKRSLPSGDVGAARGSARPAVGGVSMGAPSLALPSAGQFTHERLCFDGYRPCGLRLRELASAPGRAFKRSRRLRLPISDQPALSSMSGQDQGASALTSSKTASMRSSTAGPSSGPSAETESTSSNWESHATGVHRAA